MNPDTARETPGVSRRPLGIRLARLAPVARHTLAAARLVCVSILLLWPQTAASDTLAFEEVNGQVVMEAEHYDDNIPRGSHSWTLETAHAGYSGSGYIEASPNGGTTIGTNYVGTSPEVVYRVNFSSTGTYYVWVRGAGPSGFDDTVHAGIDGTGPASADQLAGFTVDWIWKRDTRDQVPATIVVTAPGLHTIHLWMREDGMKVDKILLRIGSSATPPSGTGPAESNRVDTSTPPPPPPPSDTLAFEELEGQVVMEAEHYDDNIPRGSHAWTLATAHAGYSGTGYVEATPNIGTTIGTNYVTTSPEVAYRVKFSTPGTYYVWVRGAAPGGFDDTLHAGIDGTGPASADQMALFTVDWIWRRDTRDGVPASIVVTSAGVHTFHLWMREDGMKVDKILLRLSSSSTPPSGTGPAESNRVDTSTPPPPPPPPGTDAFAEEGGQVVMEAEHYDGTVARSGHSWTLQTAHAGYSDSGYIEASPNDGTTIGTNYVTTSPEVVYRVNFSTTGTYYVWLRGAAPGGFDDTVHAGIDGTGPASADQLANFTVDWIWNRGTRDGVPASIVVTSPGVHTFHLWMREDGMKVDKILLRTSSSSTPPSGIGPVESARVGAQPGTIHSVRATGVVSNRATISWATDQGATTQVEYGTTTAYGQTSALSGTLVTRHVVNLVGLTPGTVYHYRVRSQDAGGTLAVSPDQVFTTPLTHVFTEVNGQVVFEAEHYHVKIPRNGKDWEQKTSQFRYAAQGYLEATPNTGGAFTSGFTTTSPELVYNVNFTSTGTYYVWIRGAALSGDDDTLHAGIDGTAPTTADEISGFFSSWSWRRTTRDGTTARITVATPGVHTFHLWMREDGMRVDRILLRKDSSSAAPAGAGPPESVPLPRVMALGDSITRGAGDADVFGYRDHLDFILGVGEQHFVGTFQDPLQDPIYDVDHEGINGNTTDQVQARLAAALAAHMALPNPSGSRVLLHIGTNDLQDRLPISSVVENVEQIINMIHAHDPSINVYVALMIPSTIDTEDAIITDYNNALAARLNTLRATTKPNLFTVDMNTAFKENPSWKTQYMFDAFHPNDAGYAVMAQVWAQVIDASE